MEIRRVEMCLRVDVHINMKTIASVQRDVVRKFDSNEAEVCADILTLACFEYQLNKICCLKRERELNTSYCLE